MTKFLLIFFLPSSALWTLLFAGDDDDVALTPLLSSKKKSLLGTSFCSCGLLPLLLLWLECIFRVRRCRVGDEGDEAEEEFESVLTTFCLLLDDGDVRLMNLLMIWALRQRDGEPDGVDDEVGVVVFGFLASFRRLLALLL